MLVVCITKLLILLLFLLVFIEDLLDVTSRLQDSQFATKDKIFKKRLEKHLYPITRKTVFDSQETEHCLYFSIVNLDEIAYAPFVFVHIYYKIYITEQLFNNCSI